MIYYFSLLCGLTGWSSATDGVACHSQMVARQHRKVQDGFFHKSGVLVLADGWMPPIFSIGPLSSYGVSSSRDFLCGPQWDFDLGFWSVFLRSFFLFSIYTEFQLHRTMILISLCSLVNAVRQKACADCRVHLFYFSYIKNHNPALPTVQYVKIASPFPLKKVFLVVYSGRLSPFQELHNGQKWKSFYVSLVLNFLITIWFFSFLVIVWFLLVIFLAVMEPILFSCFYLPNCSYFGGCINFTFSEHLTFIYSSTLPFFRLRFVIEYISPFAKVSPITRLDKVPPVVGFPRRAHVSSIPLVTMYLKLLLFVRYLKDILAGYEILSFLIMMFHCCLALYVAFEKFHPSLILL